MADDKKFTAIVFFHGIGQQSRYEELSRILEAFDDYAIVQEDDRLHHFTVGVETSRSDIMKKNVGYAKIVRDKEEIRFYEVYWAPLTNSGTTGRDIIRWFLGLVRTPVHILNSHWNSRRRLRVSYLYALWDKKYRKDQEFLRLRNLINHYNEWCDNPSRIKRVNCSFDDFLEHLDESDEKPDKKTELKSLARDWHNFTRHIEWRNDFVFLTITYIMLILPLLTLGRVVYLLTRNISTEFNATLWDLIRFVIPVTESPVTWEMIRSHPESFIFYLLLLLSIPMPWIIAGFLRAYGGDVQLWATYQETNEKYLKRKEILNRGLETMTHVLQHENCERVIVLAHSLGSAIAYDSLLSIGRHNRAVDSTLEETPDKLQPRAMSFNPGIPSAKVLSDDGAKIPVHHIEYFVTMGSPIDKMHYFFESRQGLFRPSEMMVDDFRGDISIPPFVNSRGIRNFRWINFWSQEDYISGPLYTPNPRIFKQNDQIVDNVPVKSYELPSPARSHVGYFKNDTVIGVLYRLIFRRQDSSSSRALEAVLKSRPKLSTNRLRDGMLLLSWGLLFAIVGDMFAYLNNPLIDLIATAGLYVFFVFFGVLIGAIILSLGRNHLNPFKQWDDDVPSEEA